MSGSLELVPDQRIYDEHKDLQELQKWNSKLQQGMNKMPSGSSSDSAASDSDGVHTESSGGKSSFLSLSLIRRNIEIVNL